MLSVLTHLPICPSLTKPQGSALVRTLKGIFARNLLVLCSHCIRLWCVCVQARETLLQLFMEFVMGNVLHAVSQQCLWGRWKCIGQPESSAIYPPLMWKEPKLRVRAVMSVELHDKDKSSDLRNIIIAQEAKQGWAKKWPEKSQLCYLANVPDILVRNF